MFTGKDNENYCMWLLYRRESMDFWHLKYGIYVIITSYFPSFFFKIKLEQNKIIYFAYALGKSVL